MKKKLIRIVSIIVVLFLCCFLNTYVDAKTEEKKSAVYAEVIKNGDTVYCNCYDIYKVDLKTGKVKTLVKLEDPLEGVIENMSLKGDWLYYYEWTCLPGKLCRVNTKTGIKEIIGEDDNVVVSGNKYSSIFYEEYAVIGSKIYCNMGYLELNDEDHDGILSMKMDLDGSNKEEADINISMDVKETNALGYETYVETPYESESMVLTANYLKVPERFALIIDYLKIRDRPFFFRDYLRIPEKTIFLGNFKVN